MHTPTCVKFYSLSHSQIFHAFMMNKNKIHTIRFGVCRGGRCGMCMCGESIPYSQKATSHEPKLFISAQGLYPFSSPGCLQQLKLWLGFAEVCTRERYVYFQPQRFVQFMFRGGHICWKTTGLERCWVELTAAAAEPQTMNKKKIKIICKKQAPHIFCLTFQFLGNFTRNIYFVLLHS